MPYFESADDARPNIDGFLFKDFEYLAEKNRAMRKSYNSIRENEGVASK